MPRTIAVSSTTQLSRLVRMPVQEVDAILVAAGVKPVSEIRRARGIYRTYPRRQALEVLRQSDAARVRATRDQLAAIRAEIMRIEDGLRDGTYLRNEVLDAAIDRRGLAVKVFGNAVVGRAPLIAAAAKLPDSERRAAILNAIDPDCAYLLEQYGVAH